jgi:prepilin-type N-terminal cleavage/methylation domain-containing protein
MLNKIQKRKEGGFTIIEVLIVLAIAGLIMLVVFLAVPALQRNSRNTQYRNEASQLLTAYSEVSSNAGGSVLSPSGSGTAGSDAASVLAAVNNKNITTVTIATETGGTPPATGVTNAALIRTGAKCTAPNSSSTDPGSTRQVAILFNVETSSTTQAQCIDS